MNSRPRPRAIAPALLLLLLLLLLLPCMALAAAGRPPVVPARGKRSGPASLSAQPAALRPALRKQLGQMPLYFVENRGQADPRVFYYVPGRDTSVYFTRRGLSFSLAKAAEAGGLPIEQCAGSARRWTVALDFLGSN